MDGPFLPGVPGLVPVVLLWMSSLFSLSQAPVTLSLDVILLSANVKENVCADFEAPPWISHLEVSSIVSVPFSVFSPKVLLGKMV